MATNARFTWSKELPEASSWIYRATLQDVDGQPIFLASIVWLTLTLYDVATNAIINGVNGQDIRNVDRGTVGATDGSLRIKFKPSDTVILNSTLTVEPHIALVRCTYNNGDDAWVREIYHKVTNLVRVP